MTDRAEVLVIAHRLRRLAPRNADVLALTDYVLGGGGKIEEEGGEATEREAQLLKQGQQFQVAMAVKVKELEAEIERLNPIEMAYLEGCEIVGELRAENERLAKALASGGEVARLAGALVGKRGRGRPRKDGALSNSERQRQWRERRRREMRGEEKEGEP